MLQKLVLTGSLNLLCAGLALGMTIASALMGQWETFFFGIFVTVVNILFWKGMDDLR